MQGRINRRKAKESKARKKLQKQAKTKTEANK